MLKIVGKIETSLFGPICLDQYGAIGVDPIGVKLAR